MIKLSIIIPIYNAEAYIARCLDSVYNQGVAEEGFEVLAINDGTPDGSMEIVGSYAAQHANLTIINKVNGGVSSARNKGIESAQGEFVLFLDADDELIEGSLQKLYLYLCQHHTMDMLVTRQMRSNNGREHLVAAPSLVEHRSYSGIEAYRSRYVRIDAGGGVCRTDFLRRYHLYFSEGVRNAEDTIFFGLFQVYAESIVYYDLPLYRIYELDGSASRCSSERLGRSLIVTMRAVAKIKEALDVSAERRGIFDYVVYQLLSNTTACFACSKQLSYRQLRNEVDLKKLLPLDTRQMHLMRRQARLMNFSYPLFYLLSKIKNS